MQVTGFRGKALRWVGAAALTVLVQAGWAGAETARGAAEGSVIVLCGDSPWRALHSWNAPLIRSREGLRERRVKGRRAGRYDRGDFRWMVQYPPPGWTGVDFDDSRWCRRRFFAKWSNGEVDSRAGGGSASPYLRQLSLRGKFTVTDPPAVGKLRLSLAYRGGVVVYLNGHEVKRAHMPPGRIAPGSPAEMYPPRVYLKENGKPWHWWNDRQTIAKQSYPLRVRRIRDVLLPGKLLRKGTNVLTVEIHAAPWPEAFAKAGPLWSTCGLVELKLVAERARGVVANVVRPRGVQVWNSNIVGHLYDADWADPHEKLQPIRLAGARNGSYTGRVVVSSDQPLRKLRATMSELTAADGGKIPASAVRVSYGRFDPTWPVSASPSGPHHYPRLGTLRDDAMVSAPPEELPVRTPKLDAWAAQTRAADALPPPRGGAVQPVYVTVRVPPDAAAGEYRGRLAISLDGQEPLAVPVELRVIDWTLPDPAEFTYWFGLIQSPEGVARHYGVPFWSKRHVKLVGRSFEWIAQVGSKVLFIPLGAESEYGNERSMVVWIKGRDGTYTHDFSAVEKYLDVALEHLGRPRFVVVGVWQFSEFRKAPRVSVKDPATGKIETLLGPPHGSAESLAFWKPVLTKLREILDARGLGKAMLLGYLSDRYPTRQTVGVFHKILPDAGWQASRHPPRGGEYCLFEGGKMPVMYTANVWGCGDTYDPDTRRVYGWKFKYGVPGGLRVWLNRAIYDAHPLSDFRAMSEDILLSNRPGQGQIGADFWPFRDAGGRQVASLYNRFPHSANRGAGNKGCTTNQLLYPDADGAVPTIRFELIRENIQECEARIFLEKLLLEKPCRLPPDLADKCQAVLDERTRWQRMQGVAAEAKLSWAYSGWEERSARLYEAAAQAAAVSRAPPRPQPGNAAPGG